MAKNKVLKYPANNVYCSEITLWIFLTSFFLLQNTLFRIVSVTLCLKLKQKGKPGVFQVIATHVHNVLSPNDRWHHCRVTSLVWAERCQHHQVPPPVSPVCAPVWTALWPAPCGFPAAPCNPMPASTCASPTHTRQLVQACVMTVNVLIKVWLTFPGSDWPWSPTEDGSGCHHRNGLHFWKTPEINYNIYP